LTASFPDLYLFVNPLHISGYVDRSYICLIFTFYWSIEASLADSYSKIPSSITFSFLLNS